MTVYDLHEIVYFPSFLPLTFGRQACLYGFMNELEIEMEMDISGRITFMTLYLFVITNRKP